MDDAEYLNQIIEDNTLADDSSKIEDLRAARESVEGCLRKKFKDVPRIRYGGSYKKGTMVSTSYDLDILCYFPRDSNVAGETLEEIYQTVSDVLGEEYDVQPKRTALRIAAKEGAYLRIDVVPGRFIDDTETDVFMHQSNNSDKDYLKTNPDIHISHVVESGVRPVIRLIKIWRDQQSIEAKTFVLELLVIKLLDGNTKKPIDEQLRIVLEAFRDDADSLAVEDPANTNNDLGPLLDGMRSDLESAASRTLDLVDVDGWKAVFGSTKAEKESQAERVKVLAQSDRVRVKPYAR